MSDKIETLAIVGVVGVVAYLLWTFNKAINETVSSVGEIVNAPLGAFASGVKELYSPTGPVAQAGTWFGNLINRIRGVEPIQDIEGLAGVISATEIKSAIEGTDIQNDLIRITNSEGPVQYVTSEFTFQDLANLKAMGWI